MNWLQRLLRGRRMEEELDRELRFHIEAQVEDKMKSRIGEAEARRATRLEFGGVEQVKEECRESRGTIWVTSILQDLRFGARILARSPGFSFVAIVVLALGIGVSNLAFSLYNLVVLQSIPVRDPATLVRIQRRSPENIEPGVPYASIAHYRDNAKSLSAVMAALSATPMILDHDEQRVDPSFVTSNYFTELGAPAAFGRLLDPAREDAPGAAPAVVLSYRLWRRRFNSDPSIIGKTIHLAGKPATVVGVTSRTFANLGTENPDVWLPLIQHSYFVEGSKPLNDPKFDGMIIMWGRLGPGVGISAAKQELLALTNQLRKLYPAVIWDHERIEVAPGAHLISLEDGGSIIAFGSILILLILAVACGNLGGLLMARGVKRQREIRIRLELGARKSRVFRQLFTESVLLGLLGAIAALPLGYVVLRIALVYTNAPEWMSALPDWRAILFTGLMGVLAALLFGLLPTVRMVRRNKTRGFGVQFVVCAQVAASCVLLILAGLLTRATLHMLYTDPGFGYKQVVSIDPHLRDHGFDPGAAREYLKQLRSRLSVVPGVVSVSIAMNPPLVAANTMITGIRVDGRRVMIYPNWVSPEFFKTMAIPLLRGRYMRQGETHAVIISESLARKRWPTEDPIGKQWKDGPDMVVGVVGNTRAMELNNSDATEIYHPLSSDRAPDMSVLVKTDGASSAMSPAMLTIAGGIDSKIYPSITPLAAGFESSVARVEQIAAIISLLGGIAIFLAIVGLLGLVSYAVSQQTKEIAIRLALGADRAEIFSAVLRRFTWPVLIGLIVGAAMTAALSQLLRRGLYGISGLDPVSYLAAMIVLLAILATAASLPMRLAFRLDVAGILHTD